LPGPRPLAVGIDGRIYISEIGEAGKDSDGRGMVVEASGKVVPFAIGTN
jgi:hypothetical protein